MKKFFSAILIAISILILVVVFISPQILHIGFVFLAGLVSNYWIANNVKSELTTERVKRVSVILVLIMVALILDGVLVSITRDLNTRIASIAGIITGIIVGLLINLFD